MRRNWTERWDNDGDGGTGGSRGDFKAGQASPAHTVHAKSVVRCPLHSSHVAIRARRSKPNSCKKGDNNNSKSQSENKSKAQVKIETELELKTLSETQTKTKVQLRNIALIDPRDPMRPRRNNRNASTSGQFNETWYMWAKCRVQLH